MCVDLSAMFRSVMENILIAGAGLTGAITAATLRNCLPKSCHLTVWERTNTIGGRMNTTEHTHNARCTVDLGAQYISTEQNDFNANKSLYQDLLKMDILKPLEGVIEGDKTWPEGTQHFVSPCGIRSVVAYYLEKSGAQVKLNHYITGLQQKGEHYVVSTSDGTRKTFDCVILTMPAPDLLQLEGIVPEILDRRSDVKDKLQAVQYSTRFATGLYYEQGVEIDVPWVAKYFRSDPVIVFIAADSKKRGQEDLNAGPSLLVHASVPFTLRHLKDDMNQVCAEYILPRVRSLLPQLPEPALVVNHLWKISQVYKGYEGRPDVLILQDKPLLLCGGDSFTDSKFDRCLESASALCNIVIRNMT